MKKKVGGCLEWELKFKIILGETQGLAYLRDDYVHPIVHRHIKAKNILISLDFETYIADFGLAKLVDNGDFGISSNTMVGSYGYMVRAGDCVLLKPPESDKAPYVARVEKIEADNRNNVKLRVRWYYRPEDSIRGRKPFHGVKELFLSDHFDMQSANTIEGKCIVHSFKNYTKLENVGPEDYYCRFEYKAATDAFVPDRVDVYCKCEMPYNPDDFMVQCDECKDWYHPAV